MIKLSDYIAKRLKEHGVNHFFIVSGGGAMHLNDSLGRVISYTACHHEQACAMAAEGYARVNQKLGVVNVTTGPGGLNCLNGVFGQWTDSVPVLYISGQVKKRTMLTSYPDIPLRQLGDQEVDIISVVKPLTKYAVTIEDPLEIKYHIDKAIFEATTGRFGPVWINVPIDIQAAEIDESKLKEFTPNTPKFDNSDDIKTIVEKLKSAKRPLIVSGHGIRLSNRVADFNTLVENFNIPVVTTLNGFDIIESDNPYYIGRIGTIGQRAGNFALQNADLVLCLGTRNNIRQVSYNWENFAKNAFKIVVDIDKAELEKPLVKPDFAICSDLKYLIPELLKNTEKIHNTEWLEFCQKLKHKYSFDNYKERVQKPDCIEPYYFTSLLTKLLKENDILVMANGSACVCTFQNAVIKKGQRFISNSGDASMGYGLPAAIGAFYDAGDRNVICLEGDGSVMMNIQELQTIIHNKIPLKIFVINNAGYSSIRQTQRNYFDGRMTGSGADSGISVPDFIKVATAFGIKSKCIKNPAAMENEIAEVLNTDGPILCEVMVEKDYTFLPKLSSKILENGSMVSPSLEDMYPFLDNDEFKSNMII